MIPMYLVYRSRPDGRRSYLTKFCAVPQWSLDNKIDALDFHYEGAIQVMRQHGGSGVELVENNNERHMEYMRRQNLDNLDISELRRSLDVLGQSFDGTREELITRLHKAIW